MKKEKKRFLKGVFLGVLFLGILFTVHQTQDVYADTSDFVLSANGKLTSYRGVGGSIVIPDGIQTIGSNAFKGNSSITSVTIPDSVTVIESSAFDSCGSLTTVKLSSNVKKIEDYAFWACTSLSKVELPSSVTEVGFGAFGNCESLDGIYVPSSLTTIGNYSFGHYYQTKYSALPGFVVMGETGSAAQAYAEKYGLTFLTKDDLTAKLTKASNSKKGKASITWYRNPNVSGYQIQYATNKKFSKAKTVTASTANGSKTISSMKKGSTYYFRVRGYRTVAGKKYYSAWSTSKSVKIKK